MMVISHRRDQQRAITLSSVIAGLIGLCVVVPGCSGASKATGAEGGNCYSNGTCNSGLSCFSDICVNRNATPEAGTGTSDFCSDYGTCETGCKCGSYCLPYHTGPGGHLCAFACNGDADCQARAAAHALPAPSSCYGGGKPVPTPTCLISTHTQTTASICEFGANCNPAGSVTYGSSTTGGCNTDSDCSGTCGDCPQCLSGSCNCGYIGSGGICVF
jgi:hypothetical protein